MPIYRALLADYNGGEDAHGFPASQGQRTIVNRTDLQQLAEVRVEEARILFDARQFDGAYYLAGYAVELALKACIAKLTNQHDFYNKEIANNCFNHKPETLVRVAALQSWLEAAMAADPDLKSNWVVACDWTESSRYDRHDEVKAAGLLKAITDRDHGVLQWIRVYW